MPRQSPFRVELSVAKREQPERISRQYTSAYCGVVRAKAVLLAAEGLENTQIARGLDLPRQVVSKWRRRFCQEGLSALPGDPHTGRARGKIMRRRGCRNCGRRRTAVEK